MACPQLVNRSAVAHAALTVAASITVPSARLDRPFPLNVSLMAAAAAAASAIAILVAAAAREASVELMYKMTIAPMA